MRPSSSNSSTIFHAASLDLTFSLPILARNTIHCALDCRIQFALRDVLGHDHPAPGRKQNALSAKSDTKLEKEAYLVACF